jgi:hypothetical protein
MNKEVVYAWGNNPVRKRLKGKRCRVLAYGAKNSVLLEFMDGERIVTSRYAIRKQKVNENTNKIDNLFR